MSCSTCLERRIRCVSDIGNPRCRNCADDSERCSYEVTTANAATYQALPTNIERADSLGAALGCLCNATYMTKVDQPSQVSELYKKAEQVFALELVLEISEARLKGDLPFPLTQARLRLAGLIDQYHTVDRIVVEGEPMSSSFGAVESLLNILKAVPEGVWYTMDVEIFVDTFTLQWDSPQLQGRFHHTCSSCCQFKDREIRG